MQKLSSLLAAAALCFSATIQAAQVTSILSLDVDGTFYDVTFHHENGDSFNALWDADNDGVFGGAGSTFDAAPTFWGDEAGAIAAGLAIINFLGSVDYITDAVFQTDIFQIPYKVNGGVSISAGTDSIQSVGDTFNAPNSELLITDIFSSDNDLSGALVYTWASFSLTDTGGSGAVPSPFTPALLLIGLLAGGLLRGLQREKA